MKKITDLAQYNSLIGQPLETVANAVKADGKYVRVIQKDGEACRVSSDYNLSRLNVAVKDGIVIAIHSLG